MFRLFSSGDDEASVTNPSSGTEQSLLSGVTSYLFGSGESANTEDVRDADDVEFDIQEAEMGWELVEKRNPAKSDEEVIVEARTEDTSQPDLDDVTATSTYLVNREDGWVMTPLPCFTAAEENPTVEDSPYENLLIEHPSMSVYASIEAIESDEDSDDDDGGNEENVCMSEPLSEMSDEDDCGMLRLECDGVPRREVSDCDKKKRKVVLGPLGVSDMCRAGSFRFWYTVPWDAPFYSHTAVFLSGHCDDRPSTQSTPTHPLLTHPPFNRAPFNRSPFNRIALPRPSLPAFEPRHRCERQMETRLEVMARVKTLKTSQRKQQKEAGKSLGRNSLDRSNASFLMQSLGKKQNKKNRARNTSGAMRARVCQRRH